MTEKHIGAMRADLEASQTATVAEITEPAELLDGDTATGDLGDWVLHNGVVVVVIGDADGSERGGTVVDLALAARRTDALAAMRTTVLDRPALYTTLHGGTDPVAGSAFVEVAGTAGDVAVTTRYELRPGIGGVLVHTSFVVPSGRPSSKFAISDLLVGETGARSTCNSDYGPNVCQVRGARDAYVLDAADLMDERDVLRASGVISDHMLDETVRLGVDSSTVPSGAYVYSRLLVPLERPDSLALAAAVAVAKGDGVGEVELAIDPRPWSNARIVEPGRFTFSSINSPGWWRAVLEYDATLHPGDRVIAKVPVGAWSVGFANDAYASSANEAGRVEVVRGERTKVRVPTSRRAPL